MKVKLKTVYAGPRGNCGPGSVIDLPADEAKGLIDGDYAEKVEKPRPTAKVEPEAPKDEEPEKDEKSKRKGTFNKGK